MKTKRKPFTLLELLTAMTVFTIFMLAVMRFFGLTQDVISNATEQTSQAERVRAVMDLIATDLQNIYYEEGVNTLCYYPTGTTNTDTLDMSVYRPVIQANCKTHLVRVRYLFNSVARSLVMYSAGDNTAGSKWKLNVISSTASNVYPDTFTSNDGITVLDGVYSFKMIPKEWDKSASEFKEFTTFNPTADATKIPDMVRIELKLIKPEILEKYKVYKETGMGEKIEDSDLEDHSKTYTREVIIDKGQF